MYVDEIGHTKFKFTTLSFMYIVIFKINAIRALFVPPESCLLSLGAVAMFFCL